MVENKRIHEYTREADSQDTTPSSVKQLKVQDYLKITITPKINLMEETRQLYSTTAHV
jgi:hypothetical protein